MFGQCPPPPPPPIAAPSVTPLGETLKILIKPEEQQQD